MTNENFVVSNVRLWVKIFGILLAFGGIYTLFSEIYLYTFTLKSTHVIKGLLCFVVSLIFCIVVLVMKIKIDAKGISQIYGIELKNGKFLGWKFEYPWKNLEIRVWSLWPNPTVAIDKSRVPKIWWTLNSHYNQCMRMIAKYGKDRMMDEGTRWYFSKFDEK